LIDGSPYVDVTSTGVKETTGLSIDVSSYDVVQIETETVYDVYPGAQPVCRAFLATTNMSTSRQPFANSTQAFDGNAFTQGSATPYPYACAVAVQWGA